MSRMSQHVQELQEREGWDEISDRPSEPQQENEHAQRIRQKWGIPTWPQPKEQHE